MSVGASNRSRAARFTMCDPSPSDAKDTVLTLVVWLALAVAAMPLSSAAMFASVAAAAAEDAADAGVETAALASLNAATFDFLGEPPVAVEVEAAAVAAAASLVRRAGGAEPEDAADSEANMACDTAAAVDKHCEGHAVLPLLNSRLNDARRDSADACAEARRAMSSEAAIFQVRASDGAAVRARLGVVRDFHRFFPDFSVGFSAVRDFSSFFEFFRDLRLP
jgi:hypothetical protein